MVPDSRADRGGGEAPALLGRPGREIRSPGSINNNNGETGGKRRAYRQRSEISTDKAEMGESELREVREPRTALGTEIRRGPVGRGNSPNRTGRHKMGPGVFL